MAYQIEQQPLPSKNFSRWPSFEAGAGAWGQFPSTANFTVTSNGFALLTNSSIAWAGSVYAELDVTGNTETFQGAYICQIVDGYWERLTGIVPGVEYTSTPMLRSTNPNLGWRIVITYYDAGNVQIGQESSPITYDLIDEWQPRSWSAIAPANAAQATASVLCHSKQAGSTGKFRVDGHMFTDTPTTYVDGSMPACVWDGTAHQSTSRRLAAQLNTFYPPRIFGRGGWMRVTPKLFLATRDGQIVEDISPYMESGTVTANQDAQGSKFSFEANVSRTDLVTPYRDYLAPFLRVEYADGRVLDDGQGFGQQVGLYATVPPPKLITTSSKIGRYDGRDLTWYIAEKSHSQTQRVAAGANVVQEVRTRLTAQGISRHEIPDEGRTLVAAMQWKPGTPVLTVCNDLLQAIGYYVLWPNRTGALVSRPYIDFETEQPVSVYYGGEDGAAMDLFETSPQTDNIYNHIIVVKDDPVPAKRFRAFRKITNPASPLNVAEPPIGIGLHSRTFASQNAQTQADVDKEADRLIQEWGSVWVNSTFRTFAEPWHTLHEIYEIHLTDIHGAIIEEADGRFWCKGWKLGFTDNDAVMTHDLYRVVPYSNAV